MAKLPSEDTPRPSRVRIVRHASEDGRWEMARAAAHPALRGRVRGYCGWIEQMAAPLCRLEPATGDVPMILLFESPIRAIDTEDPACWTDYGSFVAGLSDSHALIGSTGPMAGVQVNFSPLGARLFLDRPLASLANRIVSLEDLWGAAGQRLAAMLADAPDWEARFDLLDREIGLRMARAAAVHPGLAWAVDELVRASGSTRIGRLVEEVGWSQKHFIARFEHEFGLTPKTVARVLRFDRALRVLRSGPVRLADLAVDCGYADQAHFSRDFRAFSGLTPTELIGSLLPDTGGIAAAR